MRKDNTARDIDIFKRNIAGETNTSSAKLYAMSDERVRQVLAKWFRIFRHPRYKETAPYPFPYETHPHVWEEYYPGGFRLDRKKLKPEEKEADRAYWLNLLSIYLQANKDKE